MAVPRSRFRPVRVEELSRQSEEDIVAYAAHAKREGEPAEALLAIQLMLYLHEDRIGDRVATRLPKHLLHHRSTVSAWVLERVMKSAYKLQFDGGSIGEWVNWWRTAVDRQVIAFWRSAQGQALEAETALPSEHEGEDHSPRDRLGVPFDEDAVLTRALCGDIVQTVLDRMDNAMHVAVIQQAVFEDRAAADVAAEFETSANNVDAIKKRFRDAVRVECIARGITEL